MTIATKNNAIILKDGKVAESCNCCVECIDIFYSTSGIPSRGCGGGGVQHGLRTIEIPERFDLPAKVYISGGVDDDLSIDGAVVQGGQYVDSFFTQCNPAHAVCYSFTATNRTFTVAAVDNYGGYTAYSLKICFGTLGAEGACCEGTTCTIKPQCQCQGTGKTFKGVGTTCDDLKGACCNGNTCVETTECDCRPQDGKAFKGRGTKCSPNPCLCYCEDGVTLVPDTLVWTWSGGSAVGPGCGHSCWGNPFSSGNLQGWCTEYRGGFLGAYDFLYPQLRGTYVLKRVSCNKSPELEYPQPVWKWSGTSPLDGAYEEAVVAGAITGDYVGSITRRVSTPLGIRQWTFNTGVGLNANSSTSLIGGRGFVYGVCAGASWSPGGFICGVNGDKFGDGTAFVDGWIQDARDFIRDIPGFLGSLHSVPIWYSMAYTLSPA